MKKMILFVLACMLAAARLEATQVVSVATGNFMTGSTWGTVDTAGALYTTSNTVTALTTGNLDSSSFVLGASQVAGFAIHVGVRASGSPSNTITVILRNSTTATNTCSVTANVSDLDVAATADFSGGWYFVKCASPFTPNGTDSYVIRATLSATSTAVSLYTNGVANNWAREVVRTTTGGPSAGDDIIICKTLDGATNPATSTAITVAMDSTTNTDYGSNSSNALTPALSISGGAALSWGTSASTNYLLRLSGWLTVQSGGTYSMGTSGTPIPATSTAQLEFDEDADGKFGFLVQDNATINIYGSPRTSGKNFSWTYLTADASAAAISVTVNDDTGWLNGDTIVIAPTSRTATQVDARTLNSGAGASSLSISSGLTNAHSGTSPTQAEVILRTRNVTLTSTSTTNLWGMFFHPSSPTVNVQWAAFTNCGGVTTTVMRCVAGDDVRGGTLTFTYAHIEWRSRTAAAFVTGTNSQASTATWTIDHCTFYWAANVASAIASILSTPSNMAASFTITNNVFLGGVTTGTTIIQGVAIRDPGASGTLVFANNRLAGWGNSSEGALAIASDVTSDASHFNVHDLVIHSNAGHGFYDVQNNAFFTITNCVLSNLSVWRNNGTGLRFEESSGYTLDGLTAFGNNSANIDIESGGAVQISNSTIAADSTFATTNGIVISIGSAAFEARPNYETLNLAITNTTFGQNTGIFRAHTNDVLLNGVGAILQIKANKVLFASGTEISGFSTTNAISGSYFSSYLASQSHDQTNGNHKTITPYGTLAIETSTYENSPSMKLTPTSASFKLASNALRSGRGLMAPVSSGATITVGWDVQKDGSYNGNAPRLILKANPALGVASDIVIDTLSVGASTWETLTGTTPTASDSGVFEFVIDCDGTAGNVFIDNPTINGGAIGDSKWLEGLPVLAGPDVGGGGAGGEHAYPIFR